MKEVKFLGVYMRGNTVTIIEHCPCCKSMNSIQKRFVSLWDNMIRKGSHIVTLTCNKCNKKYYVKLI